MNRIQEHIFNASYLAIFLYGLRRIARRIRPISFDAAYAYVTGLVNKPGERIFLVGKDGTYYHVANAPTARVRDVVSCIASCIGGSRSRNWSKAISESSAGGALQNVVPNMPLTRLIPPENHQFIPGFAQALKKAYREPI